MKAFTVLDLLFAFAIYPFLMEHDTASQEKFATYTVKLVLHTDSRV